MDEVPSRRRAAIVVALLALLGATFAVAPRAAGAAASGPSLGPAIKVLQLTEARLELMDEVMASKWLSRTPIQDTAQEAKVTEAATAEAHALGVALQPTGRLFELEIVAAKEVQLGWGKEWLFYGAPPELAAPDLTQLRAELSAISTEIVALLPGLFGIKEAPMAEPRLARAAARILTVRHLSAERVKAIVAALLAIRPAATPREEPAS